jgi:two-component system, NarL family, invasion response regulator UvrY
MPAHVKERAPMSRILLIDDHAVVRDGIKRMVDDPVGSFTFGEADTPQSALRLASEQDWDVVILDISLGDRSGLEVLKELRRINPRLPVLILSIHSEEHYARRAFMAGASGYITKDSSRAELIAAIQKVAQGNRYISPAMAEKLVFDLARGTHGPLYETLSDREFQVLRLIGSGKTITEIAESLSLSRKTISTYRARLLEKMGMKTNAELTHYAVRNKLVD